MQNSPSVTRKTMWMWNSFSTANIKNLVPLNILFQSIVNISFSSSELSLFYYINSHVLIEFVSGHKTRLLAVGRAQYGSLSQPPGMAHEPLALPCGDQHLGMQSATDEGGKRINDITT